MATGRAADAEPLWKVVAESTDGDRFALADYHASQGRLDEAERELTTLGKTRRCRTPPVCDWRVCNIQ